MNAIDLMKRTSSMKPKALALKELYLKLSKQDGTKQEKEDYIQNYEEIEKLLNDLGELSTNDALSAKLLFNQVTRQMRNFNDIRFRLLYDKCKVDVIDKPA